MRVGRTFIVLVLAGCHFWALPSSAERPNPLASLVESNPWAQTLSVKKEEERTFYEAYVEKHDKGIAQSYYDQWYFHDQNQSYLHGRDSNLHLQISTDTTFETVVRKNFASQIMRSRTDSFIEAVLDSQSKKSTVGSLNDARKQMQNVSVYSNPEEQTQIRFSFDIRNDFSSLEYSSKRIQLSLYQPNALSFFNDMSLWIRSMWFSGTFSLGLDRPKAFVRYFMNQPDMLFTGLEHAFSSTTSAIFQTNIPTQDFNFLQSLQLQLVFRF